MEVGESKAGKYLRLNYKIVNRITCSPEGERTSEGSGKEDYFWHLKRVLT